MSKFDYDSPDEPSADTIAGIVADMSGKPDSLTDEEREQRQINHWRFLEQQRHRLERERYERNRAIAEAAAEREREARQQATVARAERQRQLQDQMRRDSERQTQSRQLADLHQASIKNERFRQGMMRSQANAAAQQGLSDTLDAWWNAKYPAPAPEAPIELDDEDAARYHRTWFK